VNLLWFWPGGRDCGGAAAGTARGHRSCRLEHALAGSSAASTFIRRDIGLVFQGDYLTSFGLDRICEELEA
jgi:3-hydroxyisobutyrate dehydrogenase